MYESIAGRLLGLDGCMKRQGRFIIELSERLLLSEEIACRQTLAHEVLHTCPNCQNHQACWRTYAMAMNDHFGYSIRRTQSGEELGVEPFGMPRYLLECQQCGAQLRRMRRSSLIDHPGTLPLPLRRYPSP